MFKLVDNSSFLSNFKNLNIKKRSELLQVLKKYLYNLIRDMGIENNEDSITFLAMYTKFRVEHDGIYYEPNLKRVNGLSLFDIKVKHNEGIGETDIWVEPYKIDGYDDFKLCELENEDDELDATYISSSEILEMDIKDKLNNGHWTGKIMLRGSFTGWNYINARILLDEIAIAS